MVSQASISDRPNFKICCFLQDTILQIDHSLQLVEQVVVSFHILVEYETVSIRSHQIAAATRQSQLLVNSIVLLTNGISFALQAAVLIIIGAWADYGQWRSVQIKFYQINLP